MLFPRNTHALKGCGLDKYRVEGTTTLMEQMQNSQVGNSSHLRSRSVSHDQDQVSHHHRLRSISSSLGSGRSMVSSCVSSPETSWCPSPLSVEKSLIPSDGSESVLDLKMSSLSSIKEEDLHHSSPPSVLVTIFLSLVVHVHVYIIGFYFFFLLSFGH